MEVINLKTRYKKLLADTITPVSVYLQVRDRFPNPLLLESSDYRGHENSFSYICFNPLASFVFKDGQVEETFPQDIRRSYPIKTDDNLMDALNGFAERFNV